MNFIFPSNYGLMFVCALYTSVYYTWDFMVVYNYTVHFAPNTLQCWIKTKNYASSAEFTLLLNSWLMWCCLLHFEWVVDDTKCIVVTHVCVCLCVCLSVAVHPHYCTDPDLTWGHGRGCPLVVHYWADLQSMHGLHCYGNITRTLVTSLRPSRDMTT